MNFDFQNRYIKIILLWLLMAVLLWIALYLVLLLLGLSLPTAMSVTVALLGSGYLVYRFFSRQIG